MKLSIDQEILILAAIQENNEQPIVPVADEGQTAQEYQQHIIEHQSKSLSPQMAARLISLIGTIPSADEAGIGNESSQYKPLPVPESLQSAVQRYFAAERYSAAKRQNTLHVIDTIILKVDAGLELISSTLQGLQPDLVTISRSRRSTAEAADRRLTMNEPTSSGGQIEYSILRSTNDTVMVALAFRDLHEPLTVKLSADDHLVSMQTVRDRSGQIHFDGLGFGNFTIDMSGAIDRSFKLQLLN